CSEYVRPGGYIIYSTCTINSAENEDNVDWFTANYPFEPDSIEKDYPMLGKDSLAKGYVQLLPGIDNTDGFFIARLKKKDVE
ncbi:MAG TPA: 16S rRNA (cytosine(967)-C(5))-methyltransferase, partial [Bacteroides sp.]|nr:16S rRNA (cytosine(967)-C(5))-methyltransferase [Bacteroides sp.]